jgi:hypothetical protein
MVERAVVELVVGLVKLVLGMVGRTVVELVVVTLVELVLGMVGRAVVELVVVGLVMLVLGMVGRTVVELVVVGLLKLVIGLVVVGRPVVELVVKMKRSLVGGVHVFVGGGHVLAGGVHVLVVDSKTLLNFIDGRGVGWFARSAQSAGVLILFLVSFSPMVFTSKSLNNLHISSIFIVKFLF